MRAACEHMVKQQYKQHGPFGVLSNLCDAAGVFYNVTGTKQCFKIPDDPNYDGVWDYQWCSEMLPQETYFTLDGVHDMFWSRFFPYCKINRAFLFFLPI